MRTALLVVVVGAALAGCDSGGGSGGPGSGDVGPDGDVLLGNDGGPRADTGGEDLDAAEGDGAVDGDAAVDVDDGVEPDGGEIVDGGEETSLLCEACESDEDCNTGGHCVELRDGKRCGTACESDEDCEEGFECGELEGQTDRQCLPITGSCGDCEDPDHDGYGAGAGCIDFDCAPDDPNVHPGVADPCDGVDNDCDQEVDEDFEAEACGIGACVSASMCTDGAELACEPLEPPADDAVCDGVDNDCNGEVDEDYVPTSCGHGVCVASSACTDGAEVACEPLPAPAMIDDTCDGVDENCDGFADEDYVGAVCGEGACAAVGGCQDGAPFCEPRDPVAPQDITCNGIDDDCNGEIDEDWTPATHCGVGACRRDQTCVDGDTSCTPGEPLGAVDDTCDNVDDNCDGNMDEGCHANRLGFARVDGGADFLDASLTFAQNVAPGGDGTRVLPRVVDLTVTWPAGLALRPPDDGVEVGQAALDADKSVTIFRESDTRVRLVILNLGNGNRIHPGVLAVLHFTHDGGGPFQLAYDADVTELAPDEANAILHLDAAEL